MNYSELITQSETIIWHKWPEEKPKVADEWYLLTYHLEGDDDMIVADSLLLYFGEGGKAFFLVNGETSIPREYMRLMGEIWKEVGKPLPAFSELAAGADKAYENSLECIRKHIKEVEGDSR